MLRSLHICFLVSTASQAPIMSKEVDVSKEFHLERRQTFVSCPQWLLIVLASPGMDLGDGGGAVWREQHIREGSSALCPLQETEKLLTTLPKCNQLTTLPAAELLCLLDFFGPEQLPASKILYTLYSHYICYSCLLPLTTLLLPWGQAFLPFLITEIIVAPRIESGS